MISPVTSHSDIAGGVSFQSAGPTTAKARFRNREVRDNAYGLQGYNDKGSAVCHYVIVMY